MLIIKNVLSGLIYKSIKVQKLNQMVTNDYIIHYPLFKGIHCYVTLMGDMNLLIGQQGNWIRNSYSSGKSHNGGQLHSKGILL